MYDCVILAIDTDAGYQALHEYVQGGWEVHFHWRDDHGNHMILRRQRYAGKDSD
jgi:hypothetical protein